MLLFLLCAATNDDYVALKALYESTGGSGWVFNKNWDMSNTDVYQSARPRRWSHHRPHDDRIRRTGRFGRLAVRCAGGGVLGGTLRAAHA